MHKRQTKSRTQCQPIYAVICSAMFISVYNNYRPLHLLCVDKLSSWGHRLLWLFLASFYKQISHHIICSLCTQLSAPLIRTYTIIYLDYCLHVACAAWGAKATSSECWFEDMRSHFLFCTWRFIINISLNSYLANSASCLGSDRSMPGMPPGGSFFPVMYSE